MRACLWRAPFSNIACRPVGLINLHCDWLLILHPPNHRHFREQIFLDIRPPLPQSRFRNSVKEKHCIDRHAPWIIRCHQYYEMNIRQPALRPNARSPIACVFIACLQNISLSYAQLCLQCCVCLRDLPFAETYAAVACVLCFAQLFRLLASVSVENTRFLFAVFGFVRILPFIRAVVRFTAYLALSGPRHNAEVVQNAPRDEWTM